MGHFRVVSCANINISLMGQNENRTAINQAALKSPHDFLFNLSCLQDFHIFVPQYLGLDSLIQFVFCGAWEKGAWPNIRSVRVDIVFDTQSGASHFIDQIDQHRQRYEKWWKSFKITKGRIVLTYVRVDASV